MVRRTNFGLGAAEASESESELVFVLVLVLDAALWWVEHPREDEDVFLF